MTGEARVDWKHGISPFRSIRFAEDLSRRKNLFPIGMPVGDTPYRRAWILRDTKVE